MTILELFEREDIYKILEETLKEYYQKVQKKNVDVKVKKKHFFQKIVVYPRLGIVVSVLPSWDVIKATYVWFDVQNNLPKKLFAWIYITLCFFSFGLLADASIELSDMSLFTRNTLFMPSNRKIRIYDYKKGYVDSILKVGFHDNYFKNEIKYRTNPQFDYILPVEECGDRWYREKLLRGRCLVRVSDGDYEKYLQDVVTDLRMMYARTNSSVLVADYISGMVNKYTPILDCIVREKHITCAEKLHQVMNWCKKVANTTDMRVPVAMTHGDLQTGNIYIDEENDKAYIIDWETAKKRSIWYDAATVMCSTRRKDKFSYMINHCEEEAVKGKILTFDNNPQCNMDVVRAVLLMEEMGFFLEEIVDLPRDMGSEIIERYEYEIDHIVCLREE